MNYTVNYKGNTLTIERLPNGKFKIPKIIEELAGSYGGFQPKPAYETILVAMKPLSEKTFVDQALKNGKGITWLDDCRIPLSRTEPNVGATFYQNKGEDYPDFKMTEGFLAEQTKTGYNMNTGRFPANLLVSDDVLNDGVDKGGGKYREASKPHGHYPRHGHQGGPSIKTGLPNAPDSYGDSGSYSRYFDLDKWATTLPFLIVPKASKSEKNKGLGHLPPKTSGSYNGNNLDTRSPGNKFGANPEKIVAPASNHHPTCKPLRLMSYLITLGSRKGDTVLDPFCGSGTTCIAAHNLGRGYIGVEKELDYVQIAKARLDSIQPTLL